MDTRILARQYAHEAAIFALQRQRLLHQLERVRLEELRAQERRRQLERKDGDDE